MRLAAFAVESFFADTNSETRFLTRVVVKLMTLKDSASCGARDAGRGECVSNLTRSRHWLAISWKKRVMRWNFSLYEVMMREKSSIWIWCTILSVFMSMSAFMFMKSVRFSFVSFSHCWYACTDFSLLAWIRSSVFSFIDVSNSTYPEN